MARRRVRLGFILVIALTMWTLHFAQLGDGVAYAARQLFDGFDASARCDAQFLAQEQL